MPLALATRNEGEEVYEPEGWRSGNVRQTADHVDSVIYNGGSKMA